MGLLEESFSFLDLYYLTLPIRNLVHDRLFLGQNFVCTWRGKGRYSGLDIPPRYPSGSQYGNYSVRVIFGSWRLSLENCQGHPF